LITIYLLILEKAFVNANRMTGLVWSCSCYSHWPKILLGHILWVAHIPVDLLMHFIKCIQ